MRNYIGKKPFVFKRVKDGFLFDNATQDDSKLINDLFNEVATESGFIYPVELETMRERLAALDADPDSGFLVVAFEAAKPIGGVWVCKNAEDDSAAVIAKIAVLKKYRGKGVSSIFFEIAEEWAKHTGRNKLELHVLDNNRHAMDVYRHEGFKVTETVTYHTMTRAL